MRVLIASNRRYTASAGRSYGCRVLGRRAKGIRYIIGWIRTNGIFRS
jgi:hypothetical protein